MGKNARFFWVLLLDEIQAEAYERTEERKGYRNGSYERDLITRAGSITLRVPCFRDGSFSTELFARYQRSEQALVVTLMEMVVNGVSTRKSPGSPRNCAARPFRSQP